MSRRNKQKKSCPNLSVLSNNEAARKHFDNLLPLGYDKDRLNHSTSKASKHSKLMKKNNNSNKGGTPLSSQDYNLSVSNFSHSFGKNKRRMHYKKFSYSRADNVSPYSISSQSKNTKRKRAKHRFKNSSNCSKLGQNQIFIRPSFSPNSSLNKYINGIGSPSVLKAGKGSQLSKISQGKISINGPIFLYLPGDNTKLFLHGNDENKDGKSPSLQVNPKQSFQSTSDLNERLVNTSVNERLSRASLIETEKELFKRAEDHDVNIQQASEKQELSLTDKKLNLNKAGLRVPKAGKNSDTSLMRHNINISLSDLNSSQNINCKIEGGSMHQISISSKAEDKSKVGRKKLTTHQIKFKKKKKSNKSSRKSSRDQNQSRSSICPK